MIRLRALTFCYPNTDFRLHIPELTVAEAQKVAIIGPSGAGKTTLLHLIAGILTPQGGSVHVDNVHVNALSDARRRDFRITTIGFIFQDFALLDYLNVLDNILHPYRITGALRLRRDVRARAIKLAAEMGIGDKLQRRPEALSQGEKQRVAICRALVSCPKLILADEATGNLDPANKTRILELLCRTVEAHNATLVAVTHDYELLGYFDRVIDFHHFSSSVIS
jgi:putative ABC transport system ATP-binding protein